MNFFSNSFVLDFVLSCFCKTNQFGTHISPSDRKHEISWNVMHRLPCIVYVSTNYHFEPKRFFMRLSILLLFQLTQKSKRYIFNKNETKFDKMYIRRVHSKKRLQNEQRNKITTGENENTTKFELLYFAYNVSKQRKQYWTVQRTMYKYMPVKHSTNTLNKIYTLKLYTAAHIVLDY